MKSLLRYLAFVLMIGGACAQSNLPECRGKDFTSWDMCQGDFTYKRAGVRYQGEFRNGKHDGYGAITLITGAKYIGAFKEGNWHGAGILYNPDGTISKQGTWESNAFLGFDGETSLFRHS